MAPVRNEDVDVYVDPHARVPEMDESEDNPFVGHKKTVAPPRPQRRRRKSREEVEHEERIEEAVRKDEGVTYVL